MLSTILATVRISNGFSRYCAAPSDRALSLLLKIPVPADDHDSRFRRNLPDGFHEVDPVRVREVDVEKNEIKTVLPDRAQAFRA